MPRQGFMLYHEDCDMLKFLNDETLANILRSLFEFSEYLDETAEVPALESKDGLVNSLYSSIVRKIIRDNLRYDEKVKDSAIKAKMGHLRMEYKVKGETVSKEALRLEAEEWYAGAHCGMPEHSNSSPTISKPQLEPNVTEQQAETPATAFPQIITPAELSEAAASKTQEVYHSIERHEIQLTKRVKDLADESIRKYGAGKVLRNLIFDQDFLDRLKEAANQDLIEREYDSHPSLDKPRI